MRSISTLFLIILVALTVLNAQYRDVRQAQELALSFLSKTNSVHQRAPMSKETLVPVSYQFDSQQPCFHIFTINENNGFIVVSADERTAGILAYSDKNSFDAGQLPPALKYWLSVYEEELKMIRNSGLSVAKVSEKASIQAVAPLLGAIKWDQGNPYNQLCPLIPSTTNRTVTGCVATGMAQMMRYHRWPVQGTGSKTYTTTTLQIPLTVNFSQTTYDWDNMTATYGSVSTETQKTAVATLMYHAGVAVEMDYNTESSATFLNMARALHTHFGYDRDLQLKHRDFFTREQWQNYLLTELYASRPVLYGGTSSNNSGHLWVCDGVDQNGYFHFNWGWGGLSNGYFLVTALNPSALGTGGGIGGYNAFQHIAIGVHSPDAVDAPRLSMYMRKMEITSATNITRSGTFSINCNELFNRGIWPVAIQFGLGLYNGSNLVTVVKQYQQNSLDTNYGWNNLSMTALTIPTNVPAGNYQLHPIIRNTGQQTWDFIPVRTGFPDYINVAVTASSITLSYPSPEKHLLALQELKTVGNVYQAKTGRFSIAVRNDGLEYLSFVKVKLSPVTTGDVFETAAEMLNLKNGEADTLVITGTVNLTPGEYWMKVMIDDLNNAYAPGYANLGDSVKINVQATPVTAPVLALTEIIAFPDNSSVPKENASLRASITNTGGLFEGKIIAFLFTMSAGSSIGYIGYQDGIFDTNETVVVYFNGNIQQEVGNYRIALYYQNNGWQQFQPTQYSLIPFTLVNNAGTAVPVVESKTRFSVYPNPAVDEIRVSTPTILQSVSVYSMEGKQVWHSGLHSGEELRIQLHDWMPGVYMIRAESQTGETQTYRFVKK